MFLGVGRIGGIYPRLFFAGTQKMRLCLSVFLVVTVVVLPCKAAAWSFSNLKSGYSPFLAGVAGGLAGHELGHIVVASAKGYKVRWDEVSIVYPDIASTGPDRLQVASAGFQAQWLLAEFAFGAIDEGTGKRAIDSFGAGLICADLGISLAYLTFLKDHPKGDIVGMAEATGVSRDRLALALAMPAVLDSWRLLGRDVPDWVPRLSILGKGLGIGWVWTY